MCPGAVVHAHNGVFRGNFGSNWGIIGAFQVEMFLFRKYALKSYKLSCMDSSTVEDVLRRIRREERWSCTTNICQLFIYFFQLFAARGRLPSPTILCLLIPPRPHKPTTFPTNYIYTLIIEKEPQGLDFQATSKIWITSSYLSTSTPPVSLNQSAGPWCCLAWSGRTRDCLWRSSAPSSQVS